MDIKNEIMQICEISDNHKCKVFDVFNIRFVIGFVDFAEGRQWYYYTDNSTHCTIWADLDKIMERVKPIRIYYK